MWQFRAYQAVLEQNSQDGARHRPRAAPIIGRVRGVSQERDGWLGSANAVAERKGPRRR